MEKVELGDIGKYVMAETTDCMNGAKGILKVVMPFMGKVLWENGRHTWMGLNKLVVLDHQPKSIKKHKKTEIEKLIDVIHNRQTHGMNCDGHIEKLNNLIQKKNENKKSKQK